LAFLFKGFFEKSLGEKVVRLAWRLSVGSDLQEQVWKPATGIARTQPSTPPVFATVNGQEDFFSRAFGKAQSFLWVIVSRLFVLNVNFY